jgi:hypothetical protein
MRLDRVSRGGVNPSTTVRPRRVILPKSSLYSLIYRPDCELFICCTIEIWIPILLAVYMTLQLTKWCFINKHGVKSSSRSLI